MVALMAVLAWVTQDPDGSSAYAAIFELGSTSHPAADLGDPEELQAFSIWTTWDERGSRYRRRWDVPSTWRWRSLYQ